MKEYDSTTGFVMLSIIIVILLAVFVALKLFGFLQWSWLWILSPLWIPFVIVCLLSVALLIYWSITK